MQAMYSGGRDVDLPVEVYFLGVALTPLPPVAESRISIEVHTLVPVMKLLCHSNVEGDAIQLVITPYPRPCLMNNLLLL